MKTVLSFLLAYFALHTGVNAERFKSQNHIPNPELTSSRDYITVSFSKDTGELKSEDDIRFEYEKPIHGVRVKGIFRPKEKTCRGYFRGEIDLRFTRVSDLKTFHLSLDHMSFLHRADCENYKGDKQKPYSEACIVKNNRLLRYDRFRNSFQGRDGKVTFESKQPLEFLDIDFDGKNQRICKSALRKLWVSSM